MTDFEKMTNEQMTNEQMPNEQMPNEQMPNGHGPEAAVESVPVGEMPQAEMPQVEMPQMEMPQMEMPRMEMPRMEMPTQEAPMYTTSGRDIPMPEPKKKSPKVLVAVIIGLVLLAMVAVAVAYLCGAFASKKQKVLNAMTNTFTSSSQLAKDYTKMSTFLLDSYTMDVEVEVEGNYMEMQYAVTDDETQISGDFSIEDTPEIEFLAAFTDSQLKVQIPMISDYVLTYDYKAEKTGYLASQIGEENIKIVDMLCEMMNSASEMYGDPEVMAEKIMEEYDSIEFEDAEKREYDVNGVSRTCAAYKTEITEDDVVALVDIMEESVSEEYVELMAQLGADVGEIYEQMRNELSGMEDIALTFYIYKNNLACISVEVDGDEAEILFDKEDGMLNFDVVYDDEVVIGFDGYVDGDEEWYVFMVEGRDMLSLVYNREDNGLEIVMEDEYGNPIVMRGSMEVESDSAIIEITEVQAEGETVELLCAVTVTKGAELKEFEGEEFDIGNATEEEIMQLAMGMSSMMY